MSTDTIPHRDRSALDVRRSVLEVAQQVHATGLVVGTAGNISGRMPGGDTICMTPSSLPYEAMTVDDLMVVDLAGEVVEGHTNPSTEKSLHLECYRNYAEVNGVIHSHAPHASMFALVREPIPAVIEEAVVYLGGEIPVCEYQMTGTDELGVEVASKLENRSAALIANHGLVCVGKSPEDALHASLVAERTAQIAWGASQLGTIASIPDKVRDDFAAAYTFVRQQMWNA